jgi:hypothetical protein
LPAPAAQFSKARQHGLGFGDDPGIIVDNSVKGKRFRVFSISETNAPLRDCTSEREQSLAATLDSDCRWNNKATGCGFI